MTGRAGEEEKRGATSINERRSVEEKKKRNIRVGKGEEGGMSAAVCVTESSSQKYNMLYCFCY